MRIAIVGAAGRTGTALVRQALDRGHEVVAIARDATAHRLDALPRDGRLTCVTAPVVSDAAMLTRALDGCDAVVAILISVRKLRATTLVSSLAEAGAARGVRRFVFTAGEITAPPEAGESFSRRQRLMKAVASAILWLTPFSLADMVQASADVRSQADWDWTIVRAPTLGEAPAVGYRLGRLDEVTGAHKLPRADYAACLLDAVGDAATFRRMLTVLPARPARSTHTRDL